MKIVAIVPIKKNSKRIKSKNFKKVKGKPLYSFLLNKLVNSNFDEVYIDTNSREIKNFSLKKGYKVIDRLPRLSKDNANGNDLLNYHAKIVEADVYFQLFVTAPFLSINTINSCINFMKKKKNYDSILTCKGIYSWFWFKKKPVNYSPKILPRSQDAMPIIQETTALYGIRRESLLKNKCRIGNKPFFYEVPDGENIDIDTLKDFELFKFLLGKRKNKKK